MIEKILDNYYTKKTIDEIKFYTIRYFLDFNYIFEKDRVLIECKNKKYKDFTPIIQIDKKRAFSYLCDYDNFIKHINKLIDDYCKENK